MKLSKPKPKRRLGMKRASSFPNSNPGTKTCKRIDGVSKKSSNWWKHQPQEEKEIESEDSRRREDVGVGVSECSIHARGEVWRGDFNSALQQTNPWTKAEPQQIVAQRLLSCLQYLVQFRSYTKDLTRPELCIVVKYSVDRSYCYTNEGQGEYRRISQHGFWFRGVQS